MKIAFRVDSSFCIGTGHLMRCLTLAHMLRKYKVEPLFICRELQGNCGEMVLSAGFRLISLPADLEWSKATSSYGEDSTQYPAWLETTWERDALETLHAITNEQLDWLIVDHYALDYRWEEHVAVSAKVRIFVIDDLANRRHNCQAILDQNLRGDHNARYSPLLLPNTKTFFGVSYCLLSDGYNLLRARSASRERSTVNNVFVFFGGVDNGGTTLKVLSALGEIKEQFSKAYVICGARNPHIEQVANLCKELSTHHTNFLSLVNATTLPEIIADCDIGLGAGGVNTWERCALGLPSIVISVAKNQLDIAKECAQAGITKFVGEETSQTEQTVASEVASFIADRDTRLQMSATCLRMFNSNGTELVADYLLGGAHDYI